MSQTVCAFCKQPLEGVFFRLHGQDACERCAGQIQNMRDRYDATPTDTITAGAVGFFTAAAFAGLWAYAAKTADRPLGIIGIFAGFVVSFVVMKAIGDRRSRAVQWVCIVASVLALYLGKALYYSWVVAERMEMPNDRFRWLTGFAWPWIEVHALGSAPQILVFTLLWFAVAIYDARRRSKPLQVHLEGPYRISDSASPLSFDRADFGKAPENNA